MGDKSRLCAACGHWAEQGLWVEDNDGRWYVCDPVKRPECTGAYGATVLLPQPPLPEVRY